MVAILVHKITMAVHNCQNWPFVLVPLVEPFMLTLLDGNNFGFGEHSVVGVSAVHQSDCYMYAEVQNVAGRPRMQSLCTDRVLSADKVDV